MKHLHYLVVISVVFAVAVFSSCTKMKEDKIAETWRLVKVDVDSTVTHYELWQFDGQQIYMLSRPSGGTTLDTLQHADYSVKAGLSKTIITVTNCGNAYFNGDWDVLTLNKDILVILNRTDGEFIYREFIRE